MSDNRNNLKFWLRRRCEDANGLVIIPSKLTSEIADYIEMLENRLQWTKVEDISLEDGELVVVYDPTNEPTVWPAKWNERNMSFSSNGGWFEPEEVTHVMRLPIVPKE